MVTEMVTLMVMVMVTGMETPPMVMGTVTVMEMGSAKARYRPVC
jgi:hypothetical protein